MRVMLKIQTPVEAGNEAVKNGSLEKNIRAAMEEFHPEAVYFIAEDGMRTSLWFLNLKEPSQIPEICEPIFQGSHAKISITPAMNVDDLMKGIKAVSAKL